MPGKNLVIAIYSHPEYYPPTLNALEYLSGIYDHIYLVHKNVHGFDWKYPANVTLLCTGETLSAEGAQTAGRVAKMKMFFSFVQLLRKTIKKHKPHTALMYDNLALFAFRLVYRFIKKPQVFWYHNHDVSEPQYMRKYSLTWWAWKSEQWAFPKLDFFSLPAMERRDYFPMNKLKGTFLFIPNFPSVKVYGATRAKEPSDNTFKLLYQGSIGPLHGLEEIIPLLPEPIAGKNIHLVLKGFVSSDYLEELKRIAREHGVEDRLQYIPPGGYKGVVDNARTCHAGIGIHKKQDVMNKTLGTASNKIYEYAASGMAVLLFDNEHFRASLSGRSWVFFTDTSRASLLENLTAIITGWETVSDAALNDFKNDLCFEKAFLPIIAQLEKTANAR